jgi:hypothetical protein
MQKQLLARAVRPPRLPAAVVATRASARSGPDHPHTSTTTTTTTSANNKPIVATRATTTTTMSASERRLRRLRRRARLQQQQPVEMPLPGATLWLLERDLTDPLYGDGFVLTRRADDEWAWVDHDKAAAAASQPPPPPPPRRPLALPAPLFSLEKKLLPYQRECLSLVSVPVGDDEAAQLGIVPWQDPEQPLSDADAAMQSFLFGSPPLPSSSPSSSSSSSSSTWDPSKAALDAPIDSASPRRTARIRFTCRRCGATTQRPINPHAWRRGTVFATCGGCGVTHKLIDNLRLFHELSGPVFGGGGQGAGGGAYDLTPPPLAAAQGQQPGGEGQPGGGSEAPPDDDIIISTDFRAGRWAADGELGLPLGLRWLVEEDDRRDGGSGSGHAQA